jgi:predicted protein tyrosine phosphatase
MDTEEESPTVVLGSLPLSKANLEELSSQHGGKLAIVSLNAAWELVLQESELKAMGIDFLRLPTPDFFAPSAKDIEKGVRFIEKQLPEGTSVLCHCNAGRGRSAVIVLCFLMKYCGMNLSDAYGHVRARRKIAHLDICCGFRPQWRACRGYERRLQGLTKNPQGNSQSKCAEDSKAKSQSTWAQEGQEDHGKAGSKYYCGSVKVAPAEVV